MSKYYNDEIQLECACFNVSIWKWEKLMKGAVKANGLKIRRMIKKQLPELYHSLALNFYNPYECRSQKTATHYIYVSSGIEYFLRRS